jgi:hypothetical protein
MTDDWSVLQHCLSANQATGDLMLELEKLEVTLSTSFIKASRQFLGPDSADLPLQQHHIFLLDSPSIISLSELYTRVSSNTGSATPLLQQSISLLSSIALTCKRPHSLIMFHPITCVTLHQHIWSHTCLRTMLLTREFREAVFPGSSDTSGAAQQSPADFLLNCISSSTCTSDFSYISSIPTRNNNSSRQLATDISHLGNILDDLGHPLTFALASTLVLLRLVMDKWREERGGHSSKVVLMVRQAREVSE